MTHDIPPLPQRNNLCSSLPHCCSLKPLSPLPPSCCICCAITQESQAAEEEPSLLSHSRNRERAPNMCHKSCLFRCPRPALALIGRLGVSHVHSCLCHSLD